MVNTPLKENRFFSTELALKRLKSVYSKLEENPPNIDGYTREILTSCPFIDDID